MLTNKEIKQASRALQRAKALAIINTPRSKELLSRRDLAKCEESLILQIRREEIYTDLS